MSKAEHSERDLNRRAMVWDAGSPSRMGRYFFWLCGVVFPFFCQLATTLGIESSARQPWQSGNWEDYAALMLRWPTVAMFWPLIGFSMAAMTAWAINPTVAVKRPWVQLGVVTGAILSSQFLVIVMATSSSVTFFASFFLTLPLLLVIYLFDRLAIASRRYTMRHLMVLVAIVAGVSLVIRLTGTVETIGVRLKQFAMVILMATPSWTFVTYGFLATRIALNRDPTFTKGSIGALLGWLLAWVAGWKLAVQVLLVEYAKLPTSNPNCYVSAAAAHGHPRLVGTRPIQTLGEFKVNRQMRRLKLLELMLIAVNPRVHEFVRTRYDSVGPKLAQAIVGRRLIADVAYLSLKPVEWLVEILRFASGIHTRYVDRLYEVRTVDDASQEPNSSGHQ